MTELGDARLIHLKGTLFLLLGLLSAALLLLANPTLRTAALLTVTVWAFARFYYYSFYVITNYVDGSFRYSGLLSVARYLATRRIAKPRVESKAVRTLVHLVAAALVINSAVGLGMACAMIEKRLVQEAREDVLAEDLRVLRRAIDQFAADNERAPRSLDDLVSNRYLSAIPEDPMTGSRHSWEIVLEDEALSRDGVRGLQDVVSGSTEIDSTGRKRYSDW